MKMQSAKRVRFDNKNDLKVLIYLLIQFPILQLPGSKGAFLTSYSYVDR